MPLHVHYLTIIKMAGCVLNTQSNSTKGFNSQKQLDVIKDKGANCDKASSVRDQHCNISTSKTFELQVYIS